jgi:hypothetical protein
MNVPGFSAESCLARNVGIHRSKIVSDHRSKPEVFMQLDDRRFPKSRFLKLKNWDKLFASPGPLETTCDTGAADCSKRCTHNLNADKATCNELTDESRRLACNTDAIARASNCQNNCSASFPPSFDCPPFGGF